MAIRQAEHIRTDLLVLRCQEGDAAAFESLVADWRERLWLHARRLIGDEDAAYDILQEAWLSIARGIGRLTDPAAFPAWAYRIVSNKSHDWIRKECRRRDAQKSYAGMWAVENDGTSEHEDERCENLRQALARLTEADLALLALKYEECFDTSRTAEALGIPEGTVRSRLFYLRDRIRKMMKENES
jgi:RNA polymerase sigma-70 factor (ECF subfamily)